MHQRCFKILGAVPLTQVIFKICHGKPLKAKKEQALFLNPNYNQTKLGDQVTTTNLSLGV
jgi:hypothetical protein